MIYVLRGALPKDGDKFDTLLKKCTSFRSFNLLSLWLKKWSINRAWNSGLVHSFYFQLTSRHCYPVDTAIFTGDVNATTEGL